MILDYEYLRLLVKKMSQLSEKSDLSALNDKLYLWRQCRDCPSKDLLSSPPTLQSSYYVVIDSWLCSTL